MRKQRDRLWARIAESVDGALGFLPFWKPQPEPDSSVGAGCLSQFWPAPFTVDGTTFRSAEHFMMWRKATLFADPDTARRILAAEDPATAQALGRQVRGFTEPTWTATRFPVVVDGNLAKFGAHPALRDFLLDTGDLVLVEASPVDRVWGAGLAADHPDITVPGRWRGQNLLGFALMEVRDRLRDGG
ncbi:NADAR family protein [Couchioplanes caeruleus]|uniref:NADAR family protein n=1 Tax=Couchioplanes caeruleus TaxID=56438 RepID=UPI001FCF9B47|nr:NADAR family protein [Couchioplanes caeruleus]